MKTIFQMFLHRFFRGGVCTAIASMAVIIPVNRNDIGDLIMWLKALGLAALFGFISGGLQALDKARRELKKSRTSIPSAWHEDAPDDVRMSRTSRL